MTSADGEKPVDKHNWGSEELSKVSDIQEDKDDLQMSSDALGKLFKNSAPVRPKINIKKEDLQMIMNELELPEATVRQALLETNGDARLALRQLVGI